MHRLELLNIYRFRRTINLLLEFEDGFSKDTYFTIPEVFKSALDIKLTVRTVNKITHTEYTQGKNFNFQQGMLIYNCKETYTLPWDETFKSLHLAIQIVTASAAYYISQKKALERNDENIEPGEEQLTVDWRAMDRISVGKYLYNPGYVKFNLYKPNYDTRKLQVSTLEECTQWDFVRYLITGNFVNLESRKQNGW